jgi:hypothetical protein
VCMYADAVDVTLLCAGTATLQTEKLEIELKRREADEVSTI